MADAINHSRGSYAKRTLIITVTYKIWDYAVNESKLGLCVVLWLGSVVCCTVCAVGRRFWFITINHRVRELEFALALNWLPWWPFETKLINHKHITVTPRAKYIFNNFSIIVVISSAYLHIWKNPNFFYIITG